MNSKAYKEGFEAKSYCDNPYDSESDQFDDFERGQTQKIKRQSPSQYSNDVLDPDEYRRRLNALNKSKVVTAYSYKNDKIR